MPNADTERTTRGLSRAGGHAPTTARRRPLGTRCPLAPDTIIDVRGRRSTEPPGYEWDRRLSYQDLDLDPGLRANLDRFWRRQFAREVARQQDPRGLPGAREALPASALALAALPEALARKAIAEGGDIAAVDRARREEGSRPIRARVEVGVFKGNAAKYEKGIDEAVVIDDVAPGRTDRTPTGTAWLDPVGSVSSSMGREAGPTQLDVAGAALDQAKQLAAVSLPSDRRRRFGDVDQPEAAGGMEL